MNLKKYEKLALFAAPNSNPNASLNRATIEPSTSKPMEDFLTALDNLVDSLEDVTAIEVIGALELVKQRLVFDLLADDEDEEDAE